MIQAKKEGTVRVLIVEDNADDEALTLRALQKSFPHCDLKVVRDGQQAVEYIEGKPEAVPDLILLDLKLPKLNGIEVMYAVRSMPHGHLVPTVMLTSSDEPMDVVRSYTAGANAFVRKPVAYEEYIETIRLVAMFWLAINLAAPAEGPSSHSLARPI